MQIEKLKIKNYRGLDLEIESIEKIAIIIGQNDSGKTNICSAILKVLDFNKRKQPLLDTDSTMCNKEKIEIEIKLTLNDLSHDQLAIVRDYIHGKDEDKYIIVKMISSYNSDTLQYEDTLTLGDPNFDSIEVPANHQNNLDKILSIVYIDPSYNSANEKKLFFKYKETKNNEDEISLSGKIEETLEKLKTDVQNEEALKEIRTDLNDLGEFKEMFDGVGFDIAPNIKLDNIYSSLDIISLDKNGKELSNIGDGKSKILSMLLKSKTYDDDKQKIYIVEEPENHLYVLLQRFYIEALTAMKPNQLIITTHSPYTVDFERTNQIIKIGYVYNDKTEEYVRKVYLFNIDNKDFKRFGYLINVEVAEMLYYNKVVLVEGDSEKYFYNMLMIKDEQFRKKITKTRTGIFSVNGIAFKTIKELLESLGISVFIKTDNDIFKVQNSINEYRYAGIERCISYLDDPTKEEIKILLNFEDLEKDKFRFVGENKKIEIIEKKLDDLISIFKKSNILFSSHNDGFEKDFLEYIEYPIEKYDDAFYNLKKAKLKNLHEFIEENAINIIINENNKNSILVSFLND